MKKTFFALVCFLFLQNILFANPQFPELSGRVVDNANILSKQEEATLNTLLEEHEKQTSNQIVIVTLNSLNGYDIADFGYQLGRYWQIGQKDKNNGVLLIASMSEKKLRIEVGYGLEGALTDKTAHEIIEYIIKPNFRQANFYKGIYEATNAIIKAIKGEYNPSDYGVLDSSDQAWFFIYFAIVFISIASNGFLRKFKNRFLGKLIPSSMFGGFAGTFAIGITGSLILSLIVFAIVFAFIFITTTPNFSKSSSSNSKGYSSNSARFGGFSSSRGGFGGGFSGGGGSFGGGGASGGW